MKKICPLLILALGLLLAGCATPASMSRLEGRGAKRVYDADYDTIWAAAIAASQVEDLELIDANKATGYIFARHPMSVTTFGQNVSIWVHGVAKYKTSVEVVSKRTGPPLMEFADWQSIIFKTIAGVIPG